MRAGKQRRRALEDPKGKLGMGGKREVWCWLPRRHSAKEPIAR
jgi:hypothetical protein